jgi:type II secretion system protein I
MKPQKGFTLLEVLVSLSIFSIVSAGMAKSFAFQLSTNSRNERKSAAILAAQQVLDDLRSRDPNTFPTSGSNTQTVSIGERDFSVVTSYCSVSSYCTSTNIRHLKVDVNLLGETQYSVSTVYAQLR